MGLCCRNWERDKNWLAEKRTEGFLRFSNTIVKEGLAGTARLFTFQERSDTFSIDDPKPSLAEVKSLSISILTGALEKVRTRLRLSGYSRLKQNARMVSHLSNVSSVLFVCKGNICRSPFAEHYASSVFPQGIRIESAGYYPVSNRPSPDEAIQASNQLGIDLTNHRSIQITPEVTANHSLILVFDEENFDKIASNFPQQVGKLFLLNHIKKSVPLFIEDPYGSDVESFLKTYRRIREAIDELARHFV